MTPIHLIQHLILDYESMILDNQNPALRSSQKNKYATAYNNRGYIYLELGEYEKALADFSQAIALNPNYAEAYRNRGNAYTELGESQKAAADYAIFEII